MWITFHIPTYTFRHISPLPASICAFFHLIFFRIVKSKKILRNNYQNIVYKIGRFILLKAFYFTGRIFPWPNKRVLRTPCEPQLWQHSFCSAREQAALATCFFSASCAVYIPFRSAQSPCPPDNVRLAGGFYFTGHPFL